MTDGEFLLSVLSDGEPHSLNEILQRSLAERGCGLTVHSRAADLRKHGHLIHHENVPGAKRGHASTYRLVSLAQPESAEPDTAIMGLASGAGGMDSGPASDDQLELVPPATRGAYSEAA